MDRPYQAVVSKGIALLDEKKPDWRDKVDVAKLNMRSFFDCILGQVFGNCVDGVYQVGLPNDYSQYSEFGFAVKKCSCPEDFFELRREWLLQLSQKPDRS